MKYALDTNVYVDSLRNADSAEGLKRFLAANLQKTYLIAVVVQELRAGARTEEQIDALESGVFGPFERRNRIITPSLRAFKESGRILAEFAVREKLSITKAGELLANDALIAATCRAAGITLLTKDSDYSRIARHLSGFRHAQPAFL